MRMELECCYLLMLLIHPSIQPAIYPSCPSVEREQLKNRCVFGRWTIRYIAAPLAGAETWSSICIQVYQALTAVSMTHSDSFIHFFGADCEIQSERHVSKPSIYQSRRDVVLIRGGENPLSWAILNPVSEGCHSHWPKRDKLARVSEDMRKKKEKNSQNSLFPCLAWK